MAFTLSPSIHKFDNEFDHSGLSAERASLQQASKNVMIKLSNRHGAELSLISIRNIIATILFCVAVACAAQDSSTVTVLAFGDVNLGRSVGQEILKGDIDYPFDSIRVFLQQADLVFVNLESQLTDQNGETQHPKDRFIFCGPPEGALSLRQAGIDIVSTANNHAFDYGTRGLVETIENLVKAEVVHVGTGTDSAQTFPPAIVTRKGIRIGFVAYTEFVNIKGAWGGRISLFDTKRVRKEIGDLRRQVDVVVASYHGGAEYVDEPPKRTRMQMQALVDAGADVVLGHHPHVPQGLELYKGKIIFYSLGNFIFYQPQRFWTQRSIGVELTFTKHTSSTVLSQTRLLPLRVGKQPSYLHDSAERDGLLARLRTLSPVPLNEHEGWFSIDISQFTDRK